MRGYPKPEFLRPDTNVEAQQPELNGEIDSCEPGEPQCKGNGLWDIWSPNDIKDVVNFVGQPSRPARRNVHALAVCALLTTGVPTTQVCARDYDSGDKGREVWLDAHVAGGPP